MQNVGSKENATLSRWTERLAGDNHLSNRLDSVGRVDWRVLRVWDCTYREQRLATTWELLGMLGVRRKRGGQGELKSCTPSGAVGGPQTAAMRLNDRPTDG